MTISDFIRTSCARFAIAPTRIKKTSHLRPGGSKWLWGKIREEIEIWRLSGCEGAFKPLNPRSMYVKEIINGTHLHEGEAMDVMTDFLSREGPKVDRLTKKVKGTWTRQNRGNVSGSEPDTDDESVE